MRRIKRRRCTGRRRIKKKKLKYQRLYSEKKNGKKIKQVKRRYYGKNKSNILEKKRQRRVDTCGSAIL